MNLDRSVEFFTKLGFMFDARFTDENPTAMIVNDEAVLTLLVQDRFKNFTTQELADAATHTEAIMALSAGSYEGWNSSGRPKSGKTRSVSRKKVSSTTLPSSISSTCSAHGS